MHSMFCYRGGKKVSVILNFRVSYNFVFLRSNHTKKYARKHTVEAFASKARFLIDSYQILENLRPEPPRPDS